MGQIVQTKGRGENVEGKGAVIAKRAPEFSLKDDQGKIVTLTSLLAKGPVLLVFYPNDFTIVCTKQLCNYRDNLDAFKNLGIQVVGISQNPETEHSKFAEKYEFGFPLLTDEGKKVAISYGCTSALMLGGLSRAVFIVSQKGLVLYSYVEPTVLTRRSADELLRILNDLRTNKLI